MTSYANQAEALFTVNHDRLLREAEMRRQCRIYKTADQGNLHMWVLDSLGDLLITVGQKLQVQFGKHTVWEQPTTL